MPIWMPLLAGAAIGGIKDLMDAGAAAEQRKTQGAIAKYSPWTGMQAHAVADPSLASNIIAGGATGLAQGQKMDQANPVPGGGSPTPAPTGNPYDASSYSGTLLGPQGGMSGMNLMSSDPMASAGALSNVGDANTQTNPYSQMLAQFGQRPNFGLK